MKRFHVHVSVDDLATATQFYATLFGAQPSVAKPDYAKWMLDDPRVNFAISARGRSAGLDHLGIQVDGGDELADLLTRLERAGEAIADKGAATCCYAKSDKGWVTDPAGLSWETFHTYGEATTYGADAKPAVAEQAVPVTAGGGGCCGAPRVAPEIRATANASACCTPQFG